MYLNWYFFLFCLFLYFQQPFKIWTETATGGGTMGFITGAGGFLQSVINGYGGLRLSGSLLNVKAVPPAPPTTKVVLQVCEIDICACGIHICMCV